MFLLANHAFHKTNLQTEYFHQFKDLHKLGDTPTLNFYNIREIAYFKLFHHLRLSNCFYT